VDVTAEGKGEEDKRSLRRKDHRIGVIRNIEEVKIEIHVGGMYGLNLLGHQVRQNDSHQSICNRHRDNV
jgi:hypothetical protein